MRNTLTRLLRFMSVPLALALATLVATPAMADKIVTKDGTVYEGEIEKENDAFIIIRIKDGDKKVLFASDISSIERDEPAAETPAKPATETKPVAAAAKNVPAEPSAKKAAPGATKIAFVTLGDLRGSKDMVGPYLNRDALMESVRILDKLPDDQRPDILVLWIDSGGGALNELEKLVPTIHHEIKPKFRTVAWIRSAISAAAMTAWACDEIYMMTNAPIGACTGFYGASGIAMAGKELAQALFLMEDVSRWGNHEPLVMRAMQICEPQFPRNNLTADIDADGNVTWYDGDDGEFLVCPKDKILTLNSIDAVKFKVARGIADEKDELAKLMGCTEWVEVGQEADAYQVRFRDNYKLAETKMYELMQKINIALQYAGGAGTEQERNAQVGRALNFLREMRGMARRSPSLGEYDRFNEQWFRDMEEQIKQARGNNG